MTGPTGSGKTSTLYSALQSLNTPETNIMTAEDPVEFNLPGINQVQMKESIGLNFAAALRSFLRQDPNIILVGEIRDFETAEIGVKAALTGHLVLSDSAYQRRAFHDQPIDEHGYRAVSRCDFSESNTGAAAGAANLQRVQDRGAQPGRSTYRRWVSGQRTEGNQDLQGRGLQQLQRTGYKGRVGLYEVMEITEELRELILVGASGLELRRKAMEDGMLTLRHSGLEKIRQGMTTLEEVVRETVK